jgi:hypothetical protein
MERGKPHPFWRGEPARRGEAVKRRIETGAATIDGVRVYIVRTGGKDESKSTGKGTA